MTEELSTKLRAPRDYYYGCDDSGNSGHGLCLPNGRCPPRDEYTGMVKPKGWPWREHPDTGILKMEKIPDNPGLGVYVEKEGWSYLGFWDRSGDSRPGSHSSFIFNRAYGKDIALERAKRLFQWVFERHRKDFELNIK